jgi:AcrR family transcriptional regulator
MARDTGRKKADRLSVEDWLDGALEVLAEGGLSGVAVEPLARRLGVTKGSFYWHFKSRDELVGAALQRWEERGTSARFAELDRLDDPREKLRALLTRAMEDDATLALDFAVQVSADDPSVAPFVRRADRVALDWFSGVYRELGLDDEQARAWALLAHSAYVGFLRILRTDPGSVPGGRDRRGHAEFVYRALLPETAPSAS